jgi:hypothetical protein
MYGITAALCSLTAIELLYIYIYVMAQSITHLNEDMFNQLYIHIYMCAHNQLLTCTYKYVGWLCLARGNCRGVMSSIN